ncbi:transposase [Corynebacterium belfantii]
MAVGQVLPTASWQRCRTHFAKNLSSKVESVRKFVCEALIQKEFH